MCQEAWILQRSKYVSKISLSSVFVMGEEVILSHHGIQNAHLLVLPTLLMISNCRITYNGRVLTCIMGTRGKSANLPAAFSL